MADFEVDGHPLGAGRFGTAWRVRHKRTRRVLVLKSLVKSSVLEEGVLSQLRREAEVHTRLKHANVVECFGYFEHAEAMYLVLEYANGGTLYEYVQSLRDKRLGDREAAVVVQQVAAALQYLHGLNVIHRDIKPENLLLFWPEGTGPGSTTISPATGAAVPVLPIVKLCDLGWSVPMRLDSKRFTLCGTVEYLPPEVAQGREYAFAYDMWTLGILAYELLVGHSPFMPQEPGAVITQDVIWARAAAGRYPLPPHVKRSAATLIAALLRVDHERRIGPAAVLAHPWIATYAGESPTAAATAAAATGSGGAVAGVAAVGKGPGRSGHHHLSMGVGPSAAAVVATGGARGASGATSSSAAAADPMAAAAGMCVAPWPDMRSGAAGSPAALGAAAAAFQARTLALASAGIAPLPLGACINRRAAEAGVALGSGSGSGSSQAAAHQRHDDASSSIGSCSGGSSDDDDVLAALAEAIADGAIPRGVVAAMERVLGQSVSEAAAAARAEAAALSAPLAAAAAAAAAATAAATSASSSASLGVTAAGPSSVPAPMPTPGRARLGPSYAAIAAAGGSSSAATGGHSAAAAVAATPVRQAPRGGGFAAATAPRSAVAMRSHTPGHAMIMAAAAGLGTGVGAGGAMGAGATPGKRGLAGGAGGGAMRVPPTPSALAPAFAAAAAASAAAASGSYRPGVAAAGGLLAGSAAAAAPSATAMAALAAAVPLAAVPLASAPSAANTGAAATAATRARTPAKRVAMPQPPAALFAGDA